MGTSDTTNIKLQRQAITKYKTQWRGWYPLTMEKKAWAAMAVMKTLDDRSPSDISRPCVKHVAVWMKMPSWTSHDRLRAKADDWIMSATTRL